MSNIKKTDITALLERWSQAKIERVELDKKIEKYKQLVSRFMKQKNTNTISSDNYTLIMKEISRTTISKRDVPENVWQKYSKSCSYPAYYLTKNK